MLNVEQDKKDNKDNDNNNNDNINDNINEELNKTLNESNGFVLFDKEKFKRRLIRSNSDRISKSVHFSMKDNKTNIGVSKLIKMRNKSFHQQINKFNDKIFSKNTSASESMNDFNQPRPQLHFIKPKNGNTPKIRKGNIRSKLGQKSEIKNKTISNIYYSSMIERIYRDYKRIKLNTLKLKNRYKIWGFSSNKKIDNVVNAKEDMLIFHLKQKYLKYCQNAPKERETKKESKSVIEKLKDDYDLIDLGDVNIRRIFH